MNVFSLYYFGPVSYYSSLRKADDIFFDKYEYYRKQTYRNRMEIATSHGKFTLTIPVRKESGSKTAMKDVKIAYDEAWQKQHWRALLTAYSNAPFFLYYQDEIKKIYQKKYTFLIDLNLQSIEILQSILQQKLDWSFTEKYIETGMDEVKNFRNYFSPKMQKTKPMKVYSQVFEDRHSFIPDLSILDLIFNEGNSSYLYL